MSIGMLLHISGEHGLANPWILIPLSLFAIVYYANIALAGAVRKGVARELSPEDPDHVRIGAVDVSLLGRRVRLDEMEITASPCLPRGSALTVERVDLRIWPPSLFRRRITVPSMLVVHPRLETLGPESDARVGTADADGKARPQEERKRDDDGHSIRLGSLRIEGGSAEPVTRQHGHPSRVDGVDGTAGVLLDEHVPDGPIAPLDVLAHVVEVLRPRRMPPA